MPPRRRHNWPGPAGDRPVRTVVAGIVHATPEQDEGDGTPPDPDEGLRRFAVAVTAAGTRERQGGWLSDIREYISGADPLGPAAGAVPPVIATP